MSALEKSLARHSGGLAAREPGLASTPSHRVTVLEIALGERQGIPDRLIASFGVTTTGRSFSLPWRATRMRTTWP
jgi:hypothetical protein